MRLRSAGIERQIRDAVGEDESRRIVLVARERLVDRSAGRCLALEAHAAGQVGLGIEVDEQHALAGEREGSREVDYGRGFTDATLLVGDGRMRAGISVF